jgi:stalled ribosome alternative rescue factor ArfA
MDKRMNKMDAETLQQFLAFRKRAGRVPSKKGKGSYNRKNFKKGRDAE